MAFGATAVGRGALIVPEINLATFLHGWSLTTTVPGALSGEPRTNVRRLMLPAISRAARQLR